MYFIKLTNVHVLYKITLISFRFFKYSPSTVGPSNSIPRNMCQKEYVKNWNQTFFYLQNIGKGKDSIFQNSKVYQSI